jgi:DNA modification methylase
MMPTELARRCILAGSHQGEVILDPFSGSGTVGRAAQQLSRRAVLIDLNPELDGAGQTPLGLDAA